MLGLLAPVATRAQLDAGLLVGVSTYEGELTPNKRTRQIARSGPSAGVFGRYQFAPWAAVRAQYQYLQIEGSDADRESSRSRNLSFFSDLHEVGVMVEFYPMSTERVVAPYVMFGVVATAHNPKTQSLTGVVELRGLGTEGQGIDGFGEKYGRWIGAVPIGAGLRFNLTDRLILGVEAVGRFTSTDHLDDVSRLRYVADEVLTENGETAVQLAYRTDEFTTAPGEQFPTATTIRGNPETDDTYLSGQATISYRFGEVHPRKRSARPRNRKMACPTF